MPCSAQLSTYSGDGTTGQCFRDRRAAFLEVAARARKAGDRVAYSHILALLWMRRTFPGTTHCVFLSQLHASRRRTIPAERLRLFSSARPKAKPRRRTRVVR